MLLNERPAFDLACRVQTHPGAPIGDVFSFLSGLYFRGKLAYAKHFARPPQGLAGAVVITPNRGLVSVDELITIQDLRELATVDIDLKDARYRVPLERDASTIAQTLNGDADLILLGSVATGKYVEVLSQFFGDRLMFPAPFVGRGDMSRGGLMLRCVEDDEELEYIPVLGAIRHGPRPPKLPKKNRKVQTDG
jgi:hypothetical protein